MRLIDIYMLGSAGAMKRGPMAEGAYRAMYALNLLVNAYCSCGGHGPSDQKACDACQIWHRVGDLESPRFDSEGLL